MTTIHAPAALDEPLGIYLHIPFCAHICPYCDFNTYSGQDTLIPSYVETLAREIARRGDDLGRPPVATVFFGGGTPSLLAPEQISTLIHACRDAFAIAPDAEISLEANPNSFDVTVADGLLRAGVNRLSLGVQTQHRRGLRVLGRQHEASDAATAFIAARQAGFRSISLDLIFGWPGQTLDQWRDDLETILEWPGASGAEPRGPEHLSLYSLIVEPGTPMADAVTRGILTVLDDDATADLYELAMDRLAQAGYTHYEVANWARSDAHRCRHNLIYWRNGNYLGLGAGAYGHLNGERRLQHLRPQDFIRAVDAGDDPTSNVEMISRETAISETMMLGLRLPTLGVSASAFEHRHEFALDLVYGATISRLVDQGLLEQTSDGVRLTPRGLLLANDVCAAFLDPILPAAIHHSSQPSPLVTEKHHDYAQRSVS